MPIKREITPQDVIDLLNWLIQNDPKTAKDFLSTKLNVNPTVAQHPSIQCGTSPKGKTYMRLLGFLNGLFGTFDDGTKKGYGAITLEYDEETDTPIKAELTINKSKPV
jgi:hypothetical protein